MNYKYILFTLNKLDTKETTLVLKELKQRNMKLGIISSKYNQYFDFEIYVEETLNTNLLSEYLIENNINNNDVLIIGNTAQAMQCAKKANIDHALALWECDDSNNISATYYLKTPASIVKLLDDRKGTYQWLDWAIELQAIAQTGLQYSKDRFDLERFQRIRDISAEIMRQKSNLSLDKVKDLFCNETGFQTPKLDTRAAIFKDNKILLVKEKLGGKWSLPGGWVDINQSIESNTIKEVKEEAGLTVSAEKLIAVQDRNKHNIPPYAYSICKAFVLCNIISGEFVPNIETSESNFFSLENLPDLAEEKNTKKQIEMCFEAKDSPNWKTLFD